GHPGDEAVGLDRAEDRAGLGIDLMDLPAAMLPDPERSLGPREPRVTAAARRRNRREHTPGLRIDPFDATLDDLEQVPAVEGRTGIRADLDRAQQLPARRIEGRQPVSRSEPHLPAVVRDAVYVVDTRKGPVLADDLGAG